ncbi:MAG: DUF975 family protein [Clostridiales bacterium]|nr:DUF975 family protein [Clostridiales bacterium]
MQQNMMGPNIIITEPSSSLRALGRNALAGKWKIAIIAVIVYTLCLEVPPAILDAIFGVTAGDFSTFNMSSNIGVDTYSALYNSLPSYSPLSGIYSVLVTGAFELGICLFFLAMFRRNDVDTADIFLGFERFAKALGLLLFQGLFIFLWMLLFIVPGIIAAIRYSQAFFILADDPTKGIRQCMDESKAMMKGNKSKYFCLSLSFIGWAILSSIPSGIVQGIGTTLGFTGFASVLLSIIAGLFLVPVIAYIYATFAGFYEILAGHLIKETEPAPVVPVAVPLSAPAEPKAEPSKEEGPATEASVVSEVPAETAASDEAPVEVPSKEDVTPAKTSSEESKTEE